MQNKDLNHDLIPINHTTMADIVEIRLREYLKKKSFRPGDPIPKETDLAEALGVSRNVLREALSRLRMLGMVETRKKRGMILARPDILGSFERVLDPLIIDEPTLKDIFELRLTLEMGLAELLYMRKTKQGIEELKRIATEQKVNRGGPAFIIKTEIAFHGKIYQMTGNETLKRFQNMLLPIFGYIVKQEKIPVIGKATHLDIVHALENGTKDEFRQCMLDHLQHHFNKVK